MTKYRAIILLFSALLLVGLHCGENDPTDPISSGIESGSDMLETNDGTLTSYYFGTSVGSNIKGFSLYVLNENPVLTAESGLEESGSDVAPDPANYTKGLYPSLKQPSVGDQFYLFVDHNQNRYFARIQISAVNLGGSANPDYARINFNWEFNTDPEDRNF